VSIPYQPKEGPKAWITFGILFMLFAVHLYFEAREADRCGRVVPSHRYATWMSPTQAYAASAFLFVGGVFSVVAGARALPGRGATRGDANI
jgi:hypothetical protein